MVIWPGRNQPYRLLEVERSLRGICLRVRGCRNQPYRLLEVESDSKPSCTPVAVGAEINLTDSWRLKVQHRGVPHVAGAAQINLTDSWRLKETISSY